MISGILHRLWRPTTQVGNVEAGFQLSKENQYFQAMHNLHPQTSLGLPAISIQMNSKTVQMDPTYSCLRDAIFSTPTHNNSSTRPGQPQQPLKMEKLTLRVKNLWENFVQRILQSFCRKRDLILTFLLWHLMTTITSVLMVMRTMKVTLMFKYVYHVKSNNAWLCKNSFIFNQHSW